MKIYAVCRGYLIGSICFNDFCDVFFSFEQAQEYISRYIPEQVMTDGEYNQKKAKIIASQETIDSLKSNQHAQNFYYVFEYDFSIDIGVCPKCGSDNIKTIRDRSRTPPRYACMDCGHVWGGLNENSKDIPCEGMNLYSCEDINLDAWDDKNYFDKDKKE